MKLITTEIARQLEASPLYSHDGDDASEVKVIAKFFNAFGAGTWYVTEGDKQEDGDRIFFGLAMIQEAELGYFLLSDLQSLRGIERDLHWTGTLADAKKAEGYNW